MYGPEYGLKYSSTFGSGTDVEIRLPARYPGEGLMDVSQADHAEDPLKESHFIQALTLLTRPEINIYEIAKECGYDDPQQFFAEFKERFGCSPEEYRRQVL